MTSRATTEPTQLLIHTANGPVIPIEQQMFATGKGASAQRVQQRHKISYADKTRLNLKQIQKLKRNSLEIEIMTQGGILFFLCGSGFFS